MVGSFKRAVALLWMIDDRVPVTDLRSGYYTAVNSSTYRLSTR